MDLTEKPDASTVDSMHSHLSGVWNRTHTERWPLVDTYYNNTFPLWPTGSNRPEWLRPSRGRAIIDHAVDHLLAFEPVLRRFPSSQEEEDKVMADNIEKIMQSIMNRAAIIENTLTWKQAGKHLLMYGYAIVNDAVSALDLRSSREAPKKKTNETDTNFERRLAVFEHKKKTLMPFRTRAPHPQRVLMDPSNKEPRVAINTEMIYSQDLHDITANRINPKTGKPKRGQPGDVEVWEVQNDPFERISRREQWTADWHILTVNGSLLFVERNDWGFVPYSQAFAGFGQEPTDWKDLDPYWLAVGMLDPIIPALKALAQAQAGKHNSLMQATFPDKFTTGDSAELMEQSSRGEIIEVDSKDAVWTEDIPNYTRWMFMAEDELQKEVEFATFASNIAGIRQPGTITVGQEAIQVQAAAKKFIAPTKQLEHLASSSASHILQLIDVLDLAVEIDGRDIQASDLDKDYAIRVRFEQLDPVFQLQLRELGLAEHAQGLLSSESYWRDYARREDGTMENVRVMMDRVRAMPAVQQKLALAAAEEMGVLDLLLEEMTPEEKGQGGQGGSQLVGPDGNPLASSMGRQSPQQAVNQIRGSRNQLRQPLTGRATKPGQTGANRAR